MKIKVKSGIEKGCHCRRSENNEIANLFCLNYLFGDDDDDFVGGEFIESISMERSNVVLLSNGNDPAQRNTSSNDIPPLLPTSSAFVDNSHQSLGSTK